MDPIPEIRNLAEQCIEAIQKGKKYLRSGQSPPKSVMVHTGPKGGRYYIIEDKHLKIGGQHHKLIRGVGVRKDQWDEVRSYWSAAGAKSVEFINKPNNEKDKHGNPLYNIYVNFGEETQKEIEAKHEAERLKFGKRKIEPEPEKPPEKNPEDEWTVTGLMKQPDALKAKKRLEGEGREVQVIEDDAHSSSYRFKLRHRVKSETHKPEKISDWQKSPRYDSQGAAVMAMRGKEAAGYEIKNVTSEWKNNKEFHQFEFRKIESEKPNTPSFSGPGRVEISGKTFEAKDSLRQNGYRYNPDTHAWSRSVWNQDHIDNSFRTVGEFGLNIRYVPDTPPASTDHYDKQYRTGGWIARHFDNHFRGSDAEKLLQDQGYETANIISNVHQGDRQGSTLYYRKKAPTVTLYHDSKQKQAWITKVDSYDPEFGEFGTVLVDHDTEKDGVRTFRLTEDGLYQGQESGSPVRRWFEVKDGNLIEIDDAGEFRKKAKLLPHTTTAEITARIHRDQEARRQKALPNDSDLKVISNKLAAIGALNHGPVLTVFGDTFHHKDWIRSLPGRRWISGKKVWEVPVPKDGQRMKGLINEINRRGLYYQSYGVCSI